MKKHKLADAAIVAALLLASIPAPEPASTPAGSPRAILAEPADTPEIPASRKPS